MNAVISAWRDIAAITNCAIELVHHVSKAGAMNGDDMGIYASRGAGALVDGVRSARYLTRMRSEEAERFGIEAQDAPRHFRVNDGKANLAPLEKATWRRMISVHLCICASVHLCICASGQWRRPMARGRPCRSCDSLDAAGCVRGNDHPRPDARAASYRGQRHTAQV